jgi:hypothetical protein
VHPPEAAPPLPSAPPPPKVLADEHGTLWLDLKARAPPALPAASNASAATPAPPRSDAPSVGTATGGG